MTRGTPFGMSSASLKALHSQLIRQIGSMLRVRAIGEAVGKRLVCQLYRTASYKQPETLCDALKLTAQKLWPAMFGSSATLLVLDDEKQLYALREYSLVFARQTPNMVFIDPAKLFALTCGILRGALREVGYVSGSLPDLGVLSRSATRQRTRTDGNCNFRRGAAD